MLTWQIIEHIVALAALYCLISLGFATNYALQRFFDISQGAAFLVGGYLGFQAMGIWRWGFFHALVLAGAGACVFGVIVEMGVINELRKRKASGLVFFIATLGVLIVMQNIIAIKYGSESQVYGSAFSSLFTLASFNIVQSDLIEVATAVPLALLVILVMGKTRFGRRIRAISDSALLAAVVGIPARRVLLQSFVLASGLSGIAGFLYGMDRGIDPASGLFAVLAAIIASIAGGVGSIGGALLGAAFLSLLETLGVLILPGAWKYTIVFGTLIVFLSFRPQGLCGKTIRGA